jgi:hypothetical protein
VIVVKIEMWPGGDPNHPRARELGRMYISNVGECDDPKRGDYFAAVCRKGSNGVPQETFEASELTPPSSAALAVRTTRVTRWPRLTYNIWLLVRRCLLGCFPEGPPAVQVPQDAP